MERFTVEFVDDASSIVHIPAEFIPEDIQFEAIANLNEEHGHEHWGEHEENITFGLLFTRCKAGCKIDICAMLNDEISCIPLFT